MGGPPKSHGENPTQRIYTVSTCNAIKSLLLANYYIKTMSFWRNNGIIALCVCWECLKLGQFAMPDANENLVKKLRDWHSGIQSIIEGILPKGPYPPCLCMADRALLAGYLHVGWISFGRIPSCGLDLSRVPYRCTEACAWTPVSLIPLLPCWQLWFHEARCHFIDLIIKCIMNAGPVNISQDLLSWKVICLS